MTTNYDNALAKYRSEMNVLQTPLICWEFIKTFDCDASKINKIQENWSTKVDFLNIVFKNKQEVIVTDKDFKIIFATDTIVHMNGYNSDEIIGKSPGFFQGKDTCSKTKKSIKKALLNNEPFQEIILNYKKNGETYWCEIEAYPKFDKSGNLLNYIAFEKIAS